MSNMMKHEPVALGTMLLMAAIAIGAIVAQAIEGPDRACRPPFVVPEEV
jgi:hypothetical protein